MSELTQSTFKSYQYCAEKDVPGYNDCPDYLFQLLPSSKLREKKKRIRLSVKTPTGNRNLISTQAPPPPSKRYSSRKSSLKLPPTPEGTPITLEKSVFESVSENSSDDSLSGKYTPSPMSLTICLTETEIKDKLAQFLKLSNKLSAKEFNYYKNKLFTNLKNYLDDQTTRYVLTLFFEEIADKNQAEALLQDWMVTDMGVGEWSPSLLKLYRNLCY
ncbi:hypothetical protein TBLA_0A02250 [Henningerozyma blattae CBS 6284]|uniref:Uncharacterized protein n=1 Tax=Henningerozyma blattae (strain ATCC 34711 / CBS 6284 / DSM 70876 / NBRC 10599 / NRRL Y-10934 / UCD 77-7) TaxID=1071380 RepID=I2GV73_HENB6|nr:hypothetical protein TBLA_0A02250 [Tetrapisispora blattae CBS 6284]CCH58025.1 hypothetical protein TBLA_0A02250 [Tetrapisispora blattae CBS 6284]